MIADLPRDTGAGPRSALEHESSEPRSAPPRIGTEKREAQDEAHDEARDTEPEQQRRKREAERKAHDEKREARNTEREQKRQKREAERKAHEAERQQKRQKREAERQQKRQARDARRQQQREAREEAKARKAAERDEARAQRRYERDDGSPALRLRILDGAAEAFGANGFAACHVRDILQASGISRPTFYKFFSNKEEAFNALTETMAVSLVQMVRSVVSTCNAPRDMLERGIDTYLRWRAGAGQFGRVLLAESKKPGTMAAAQRKAAVDAIAALFAGQVSHSATKPPDPLLFVGLIAALESMADAVLSEAPGEAEIERCKAVMFELVDKALGQYSEGQEASA